MKVKVPQDIKIGAHRYTIQLVHQLKIDQDKRGIVDHRRQTIELEAAMPPTMLVAVLLHEIIHIIDEIYSTKLDEDNIDRIAQGLTSLLDNGFVEFDWSDIPRV